LRNFFYKLACRVHQELRDEDIEIAEPNQDDFKDPAWKFKEYLRAAESAVGGRGFVIMMDEFQALEPRISTLDVDVYKMLRSIIQHDTAVDFIVAGTMQMEQLMRDYEAAMFGSAISKRLDFLEEKDARKLILSPVKNYISYTKEAEDLIVDVTACHPYFVQLVCWTLMRYLIDRGKAKVFASDVERILPQVVEQGVHFNEIWATDTSELELYLMAAIGQLTTRRQDWCLLFKVEDVLRSESRLPRDADDLNDAINNLVDRRILRYSNDGSRVRFQVTIFGQWVHTNKPLALVKRDIQAQAAAMRRRVERQPMSK
jgi:type I restriction enzyme M protein